MVKAMQHAGRRAFIAALVLLLLVAIHAAAKTNVASMMADRFSPIVRSKGGHLWYFVLCCKLFC